MEKYIEILDPSFKCCVLPNAPRLTLGEGYGWLEGPVWFADHDALIVSDVAYNRMLRWTESSGISEFRYPSNFANGHTRDKQGRLLGCHNAGHCVTRTEWDGTVTVLVDNYQGKAFNGPNDIVVHSDGGVWFTDPLYGVSTDYEGGKRDQELPTRVYRFDPNTGELTVIADDFVGPNGLCFSPDEKLIYIADSGAPFAVDPIQHIRVFDVRDQKQLGKGRVFHKISPGFADGFRCDEAGRVWSSAEDGVHCIDPGGNLIGKILTGFTVSNLVFGGRNRSRLFICASHTLMAIYTNVRGAYRP